MPGIQARITRHSRKQENAILQRGNQETETDSKQERMEGAVEDITELFQVCWTVKEGDGRYEQDKKTMKT